MANAPDDVRLVQAVAAGDRAALGELYDLYAGVLMGVGLRMLKSQQEAEDILHDVFLEVWKRAHTYDAARASVRGWLLLRMRSRCLDRLKSAAVSRRRPMNETREEGRAGNAEREVDASRVEGWLGALSEEQQAVVKLGYLEGLSAREIAARLSIPVGTAKSRLAAAMRVLRKRVGGAP